MARADLLALGDDGLVQLANAGLVKRGLREIAEGAAPTVTEACDGTIEARFADGTVTRLAPNKSPAQAACTCPASGMCRHRVSLVLAYRHDHRLTEATRGAGGGAIAPEVDGQAPAVAATWDPGSLDVASLEAALSAPLRSELARLRSAHFTIQLTRGPIPAAALPMATVRFLVPDSAAYARCDCAAGHGCAHIVLAVEAFRAAEGASILVPGPARPLGPPPPHTPSAVLREATDTVLARLIAEGATAGVAAQGPSLDRAHSLAAAQGATWLVLALEALAAQIEAYDKRSALYDEDEVLALATEIYARPRATGMAAMGFGEAMETAMGKTRLVSLGARIEARGVDLAATVALFDTDTGTAMLVEKRFSPPDAETRLAPDAILARLLAPGLPLKGLAQGQLLTSVANRRADGTVNLGSGSRGKTTLMPRAAEIAPPAPLRVASGAALLAALADQPPRFLRPRNRVATLHVFDVEDVIGQHFDSASQIWSAAVKLAGGGGHLLLQRRYDAGAPGAVDVLGAAAAGDHGRIRQLAGQVHVERGEVVCDPWSLTADRLIVPDIDGSAPTLGANPAATTDDDHPAIEARRFLARALHAGTRRSDVHIRSRGLRLANDLDSHGFVTTAERLGSWLTAAQPDLDSFGALAVWLAALAEQ